MTEKKVAIKRGALERSIITLFKVTFGVGAFFAVLIGVVVGLEKFNEFTGASGSGADVQNSIDAAIMCQSWVEKRLVSPSSAEFPNAYSDKRNNKHTSYANSVFLIDSYVDSQNKLGAMLRTPYT